MDGRNLAVDVSVANTLQTTTLNNASVAVGVVCAAREHKIRKYRAPLSAHNIDFTAFVVETYGFIGMGRRCCAASLSSASSIGSRRSSVISAISCVCDEARVLLFCSIIMTD